MSREEMTAIVRDAVHDAYRLGFGAAVQAVEKIAVHSLHPAMYHDLIARLRKSLLDLAKDDA
jgi:hypothetical protein